MKINEIKAKLAATKTPQPQAKQPVDDRFISVLELIRRIQQTPGTTAQQAADCLLSWGLLMDGAPPIIVNSKTRGLVLAEAMQQKCAIQRIEYVFHRGSFESDDGLVTSIDYELFGFDRADFASFLQSKAGEPLDLFSPLEADDFPPWPLPKNQEPLSDDERRAIWDAGAREREIDAKIKEYELSRCVTPLEIQVRDEQIERLKQAKAALHSVNMSEPAPASEKVSAMGDLAAHDVMGITKRERQIRAIEEEIAKAGYKPLAVITGGKRKIKAACKREHPDLFGAGDDPFIAAWQEALNQGRVRTERHTQYSGK
ncbi:hypothetical protein ACFFKC_14755 [Pseudoduganella danionis]|uniref:Uncharacterized protein n=1 Tax=Pseudoduganella danionis TaxID=1890295 RepID=A0ABW9SLV7_9BURK|nr:hypothetical protein [Pseudoduganella danionis]MTW33152.1 hypothetical protein [Pseudoduganella danionis]